MTSQGMQREFLLISTMSVAYFLGRMILAPILPLFFVEVGASKVDLGVIMAIPSLVAISLRIPLSTLMDRFGKWTIVIISNAISVAAIAAYGFTYHVEWLYLIAVVNALSWVLYQPASMSLALDLSPAHQRAESMGRYFMAIATTFLTGPLLASLLTLYLDYRRVFLVSTIPSVAGLFAMVMLGRIRVVKARSSPLRRRISIRDLKGILSIRQYWAMCVASTTFWAATAVFGTLFSVYCEEQLLLSASTISLLFALRGLSNTLVRIPAGRFSDKIGRKKPQLFAYGMGAVVFVALSEFSTQPLLMMIMLAYGLSWGTRVVTETALLGDLIPADQRGIAMAMWQTIEDVGVVVGSVAAGVSTLFLDIQSAFKIASIVLGLGVCVVLLLIPEPIRSKHS